MNTKRLLIADENMDNCDKLKMMFEESGYKVVTASRCDEALVEIARNEFDGFVIDLSLPETGGLEIIPLIKKKFASAPVLATSSQDSIELEQEARKCGASSYFIKPIELENMKAMMGSLLAA